MSAAVALKGLREKRAGLLVRVGQLRDRITAEGRALNTEERAEYETISKEMLATREKIDATEADLKALSGLIDTGRADDADRRADPGRQGADPRGKPADRRQTAEPTAEQRGIGLQAWMRGQLGLGLSREHKLAMRACGVSPRQKYWDFRLSKNPAEFRDQGVGTGAAGGYNVAQAFLPQLEIALKLYGGVRQVANVIRTDTGADMPMPTLDDTGNVGELLAENTGYAGQDFTFGQVIFKAWKYSSKGMQFGTELLNDTAINLEAEVGGLLGTRIGRIQGTHFTTGTGTGQPQGVVTGAVAGLTTASSTAIAASEVIKLYHTVDPAYRMGPSFGYMMNDAILQAVALLVDSQGRPLFMPALGGFAGSPVDRIYGQPVYANQHMANTIATTNVTMLCGDYSKYTVRDIGGVRLRRLEERYADKDQVGFIGFLRSDGRYRNTAAVKKLTQL